MILSPASSRGPGRFGGRRMLPVALHPTLWGGSRPRGRRDAARRGDGASSVCFRSCAAGVTSPPKCSSEHLVDSV